MAIRKDKAIAPVLAPLGETAQRANSVYDVLVTGIIKGDLAPGSQLNADGIAHQLNVSPTPVRDALNQLVKDGLVHKLPYQGWFVCRFEQSDIRDLYEIRASLECLAVGCACERITPEEIDSLYALQSAGEAASAAADLEAYRLYNEAFHLSIMRAAKNSQLPAIFGQISLKTQMLSAKTIRIGRSSRAVQEHRRLIDLIADRDRATAQALMQEHIMGALGEILSRGLA
jgi:DNA-binding GntR family transcriptional regulator